MSLGTEVERQLGPSPCVDLGCRREPWSPGALGKSRGTKETVNSVS